MQPFDVEQFPVYKKHVAEYFGGFHTEGILNPKDADEEKMDWLSGFCSMR